MKPVLWTLACVLVGVLLLYAPLYSEEQEGFRGELQSQVMAARLETMRQERDAKRWREWNASVERRWQLMASPREDSERRISAILEEGKDR